jgi:hypothetical protein
MADTGHFFMRSNTTCRPPRLHWNIVLTGYKSYVRLKVVRGFMYWWQYRYNMADNRLTQIAARLDELTAALEATPVTPDGAILGNAICAEMDDLFDEAESLGVSIE